MERFRKIASRLTERQNCIPIPVGLASASSRCSPSVSWSKRLVIWKERAIPRWAICSGCLPVMSWSAKTIVPDVGVRNPVSRLNNVVLPAPLGPTSACIVPSRTTRSTSETARKPRNSLVSARVSSRGVAAWSTSTSLCLTGWDGAWSA